MMNNPRVIEFKVDSQTFESIISGQMKQVSFPIEPQPEIPLEPDTALDPPRIDAVERAVKRYGDIKDHILFKHEDNSVEVEIEEVRVLNIRETKTKDCYEHGCPYPPIEEAKKQEKTENCFVRGMQYIDWFQKYWDEHYPETPWNNEPFVYNLKFKK